MALFLELSEPSGAVSRTRKRKSRCHRSNRSPPRHRRCNSHVRPASGAIQPVNKDGDVAREVLLPNEDQLDGRVIRNVPAIYAILLATGDLGTQQRFPVGKSNFPVVLAAAMRMFAIHGVAGVIDERIMCHCRLSDLNEVQHCIGTHCALSYIYFSLSYFFFIFFLLDWIQHMTWRKWIKSWRDKYSLRAEGGMVVDIVNRRTGLKSQRRVCSLDMLRERIRNYHRVSHFTDADSCAKTLAENHFPVPRNTLFAPAFVLWLATATSALWRMLALPRPRSCPLWCAAHS